MKVIFDNPVSEGDITRNAAILIEAKDEYQTGAVTARKLSKQPQGEQE